jgi:hypothetical protein
VSDGFADGGRAIAGSWGEFIARDTLCASPESALVSQEADMRILTRFNGLALGVALLGAPIVAQAQIAFPQNGCKATPSELEANKKVAIEFFRPGITGPERVALADPSYKQHNPAFLKGGK